MKVHIHENWGDQTPLITTFEARKGQAMDSAVTKALKAKRYVFKSCLVHSVGPWHMKGVKYAEIMLDGKETDLFMIWKP